MTPALLIDAIKQGKTPDFQTFKEVLGAVFPLLGELHATPQDPKWHGEGNVETHTALVLGQVYNLLQTEAAHLSPEKRTILVLGAMLHDTGKPLTTRTSLIGGQERTVSPRHADRGRSYLAYRLPELDLSPAEINGVMALVGHHHDPKRLVMNDAPDSAYRRLARLVDLELVYWLERADLRGRLAKDLEEQLDTLELFKLLAQEVGVWKVSVSDPYAHWQEVVDAEMNTFDLKTREVTLQRGILDAEAGLISTPHEAVARGYPFREGFAHLAVMCGPSGAGKSSWIAEHLPEFHVISLDDIRENLTGERGDQSKNGQVLQNAKAQLKAHLRNKEQVVWDATSLTRNQRSAVLALGFDYGALTTLVALQPSVTDLFVRNRTRQDAVPDPVLAAQIAKTDFPYADEAHRVILRVT